MVPHHFYEAALYAQYLISVPDDREEKDQYCDYKQYHKWILFTLSHDSRNSAITLISDVKLGNIRLHLTTIKILLVG
jgi:hypothetical protein